MDLFLLSTLNSKMKFRNIIKEHKKKMKEEEVHISSQLENGLLYPCSKKLTENEEIEEHSFQGRFDI